MIGAAALLLTSCRSSNVLVEPRPVAPGVEVSTVQAQPALAPLPTADPRAALGDERALYLLRKQSGALVLRSALSGAEHELMRHVDSTLLSPELELLWTMNRGELGVIDLRALGEGPRTIALGLEDAPTRIDVTMEGGGDLTDDGCDLESTVLAWADPPSVQAPRVTGARIVDESWLRANLMRSKRAVGPRVMFGEKRTRVPGVRFSCEDKSGCGAVEPFGARGLSLILIHDQMGGDCWNRRCLLRDDAAGTYALPPEASVFSKKPPKDGGPCGLFAFDAENHSYLLGRLLCVQEKPCEQLDGVAIGWLVPGEVLGLAGI